MPGQTLDAGFSQFLKQMGSDARPGPNTIAHARGWRSVTKRGAGHHVTQNNADFQYLCTDFLYRKMVTGIAVIHPPLHSEAHGPFVTHPDEEFIHVLAGSIVIATEFCAPPRAGNGRWPPVRLDDSARYLPRRYRRCPHPVQPDRPALVIAPTAPSPARLGSHRVGLVLEPVLDCVRRVLLGQVPEPDQPLAFQRNRSRRTNDSLPPSLVTKVPFVLWS